MSAWLDHVERWKDCTRCPLGGQRDRICLARGTVPCDVLFVGEAPGTSEDAIGLPFVGPAGQLLDQIIERAVDDGVTYALINLVACFPREAKTAGDNEPTRNEIAACRPRLVEFINLAKPLLVVCVGALAARHIQAPPTTPVCHIDHPAFILRMPLVQKQMATQKAVVVLRTAVETMLQSGITKWEDWPNAESKAGRRERTRADYDQLDIPF